MSEKIDCPALHSRGEGYPFGDKVPAKVRMLRTVTADPMPSTGFVYLNGRLPPVAIIDQVLPCWTNRYGAVSAVFPDGSKLGLRPGEFEIVRWHDDGAN